MNENNQDQEINQDREHARLARDNMALQRDFDCLLDERVGLSTAVIKAIECLKRGDPSAALTLLSAEYAKGVVVVCTECWIAKPCDCDYSATPAPEGAESE